MKTSSNITLTQIVGITEDFTYLYIIPLYIYLPLSTTKHVLGWLLNIFEDWGRHFVLLFDYGENNLLSTTKVFFIWIKLINC